MLLAARWIVPVSSPAIEHGAIELQDGRIAALGPRGEFESADAEDLGDAILIPGLINAHTHLELGHLQGFLKRPRDLPDWLLRIIAAQEDATPEELQRRTTDSVQRGVRESLQSGVTTVGDITRLSVVTRPLLKPGPLRVVSFGEVKGIGTRRNLIEERLQAAGDRRHDSEHLITALSPHAPYSVDADGVRTIVARARNYDMRTCMHLSESVEEMQFLQTGQGRFRELLEALGMWDDTIEAPGLTPVRWAFEIGALGPECLAAHCNYLDEEEIDLLCATGTSVAYCPRTHEYFGHPPHPLMKLMGGGVNVCVGTDSLVSSPSLSILEELIHVRRQHPELSGDAILSMGTIAGARALGVAHLAGTLEPGKRADLAVFSVDGGDVDKPAEALLSGKARLETVYVGGEPML